MSKGLSGQIPGNTRTNPNVPDQEVPRILFILGDGKATAGRTSTTELTNLANEIKQVCFSFGKIVSRFWIFGF